MQSPAMRGFRPLQLCGAIKNLSQENRNFFRFYCEFKKYPRLIRKFHYTPYRRFPSSSLAEADDATAYSWPDFKFPLPPQTDSSYRKDSVVETSYDPVKGRVVTKRERIGARDPDDLGAEKDEVPQSVEVGSRVYGEAIGSSSAISSIRKKGKSRSVHVCESCGYSDGQWWGTCRQCNEVGTMKRLTLESGDKKVSGVDVSENLVRSWLPNDISAPKPIRLSDVCGGMDELNWRLHLPGTFGAEVERVLGGGLVPGSLVLVGGDPGVGKSTMLLQVAALLAEGKAAGDPARVLYVSGEESIEQIANRADRLSVETEELFLHSCTDIEDILEQAQTMSPRVIIIDSIQTCYLKGIAGGAGGPAQVRECASALVRFAKKTNVPILLIGHVTKSGDIAGPHVLEHIVDVVLHMEGDKSSSHRLLRAIKNRFGSTDELGVFQMSQSGLQGVSNPSEMFLGEQHSESDYLAGLAVAVIMDGSRAFLIEIQALCVVGTSLVRHVNGVSASRADMIISVIMKQAGLKLQENGIFLNVVSGVNLTETAGDLGIAAAICSSFLEFPIPNGVAFIAEVGLGGELRMVPQMEKRVHTLAKLGYKKCVVPMSAVKSLSQVQTQGMEIFGCKNLKEMIMAVFRK